VHSREHFVVTSGAQRDPTTQNLFVLLHTGALCSVLGLYKEACDPPSHGEFKQDRINKAW